MRPSRVVALALTCVMALAPPAGRAAGPDASGDAVGPSSESAGPSDGSAGTSAAAPAAASGASPWRIPEPGSCAPTGGLRGAPGGEDAAPIPFRTGDVLDVSKLALLEQVLPEAIWEYRDRFFFEGMQLEIGPCFRDYSPPGFYREATDRFRGQPRLTDPGGLEDYTAGQPFVPDDIDPASATAGQRWAWNEALRYQAGGIFTDRFRISDLVGRIGRAEPFEGRFFKAQLLYRADQAERGYRDRSASDEQWVAGGEFFTPFAARAYAWRQFRNEASQTDADRSDDLWAYLPDWRRVRRISGADVEGVYMPSFSVGVVQAKSLSVATGGAGSSGAAGGAAIGVGAGTDTIQTKRSGFEGFEIRPILHEHRVIGVQDVLAPINIARPAYPEDPDRSFGPWGLSFASDRWDLRRVLVLEGTTKEPAGGRRAARFIRYVDLQTLTPLYYVAYDVQDEITDLGIYAWRWSEDRDDYPRWPDDPDRPVRVLDSMGASFANLAESGSWRRESWDAVSVPPKQRVLRRMLSVNQLTKGR